MSATLDAIKKTEESKKTQTVSIKLRLANRFMMILS